MRTVQQLLKNKEFVFSALLYILLFIFLLHPYRDYDWGWHYKQGEWFFTHFRPYLKDTFSWTMYGYEWVNHEWLYDPLMYLIFRYTSFLGMSIAGAMISFTCFYLGVRRCNLSYWQKGILALFYANIIGGVVWQGLRSQMVGALFLAILMYVLPLALKGNKKVLCSLPFFFLLFANLHGYFALGLAIFALFILGGIIEEFSHFKASRKKGLPAARLPAGQGRQGFFIPKNILFLVLTFFISILFTLINPYYYYVYIEAIKHSTSPLLKYILEWIPIDFHSTVFAEVIAFCLLIVFGFIKRHSVKDAPYILIFLFSFFIALTARRYEMTFAVVVLPLAAYTLKDLKIRIEKYKVMTFAFLICAIIGFEIGIFRRIPNFHLLHYTFEDYCNFGSSCSERLVSYLKKYPPRGHGLNFYNWGGYLIGREAPVKLFVDGRMHLWEGRNGFSAFLSYQRMYYEGDYERFKRDNFDWVIIEPGSDLFRKITTSSELGQWSIGYLDNRAAYLIRKRR